MHSTRESLVKCITVDILDYRGIQPDDAMDTLVRATDLAGSRLRERAFSPGSNASKSIFPRRHIAN